MADREDARNSHGRQSETPTEVPKRGWRDILLRTAGAVSSDNVGIVAAGLAFYGLLALFPAIAAILSIYGMVADPEEVRRHFQSMSVVIPSASRDMLAGQMAAVAGNGTGTLGLAAAGSLVFALWSASKGTQAFMTAMNIAYGEEEKRGFLKRNLVAIALTVFLVLLVVLAFAVVAAGPALLGTGVLGTTAKLLLVVLRWPLMAVVFLFALAVLYRYAPSRSQAEWRWVSPGSIAAVCLWVVASVAFSIYVTNFGKYDETYGSIGAVVASLMWLWLSAFVVIMGAELNAESERQTRRDTTTGPEMPMGSRGAYAADTLGEER